MKPNNVFLIPCTENSFYRAWIEFLTPYHKMTAREKDVAARILLQYFKFKESVPDPDILKELLWSKKSRTDMMESLGMSQVYFQMVLTKLRTAGFLEGDDINPRFIPHKISGDSRFMLQAIFDWSSTRNPIVREQK